MLAIFNSVSGAINYNVFLRIILFFTLLFHLFAFASIIWHQNGQFFCNLIRIIWKFIFLFSFVLRENIEQRFKKNPIFVIYTSWKENVWWNYFVCLRNRWMISDRNKWLKQAVKMRNWLEKVNFGYHISKLWAFWTKWK